MAKPPRDQSPNLSDLYVASVTLDAISTHCAGITVSDASDHIAFRSTSPVLLGGSS
jgi:hypothetical protein